MGLLRVMMPPKLQLLALLAFAVAMFFLENQIQKLEESRGKLGKSQLGLPPVSVSECLALGQICSLQLLCLTPRSIVSSMQRDREQLFMQYTCLSGRHWYMIITTLKA